MNLYSNLNYIKLFTFEQDLSKGEMGYALLTLEAVLTFAESQKESLSKYVKRLKGLLEVVETGNLSEMQTCARALTEENVDWKQFRTLSGDTVLLLAVKGNMTDVFDWRTALVWSHGCKTKWTHICGMSTVVAQDTDLDVYNIQGSSALHMSVEMGHLEMTKKLLQLNVSKDARNVQKETPVHLAVKRNDLPCLDVFLKAGLEMDVCDVKGNTPLYYAQIPCLNALLDHGAFLNHKNYAGLTPFLYQVQQAQLDTAAHYLTLPDLEIDCKDQGHRNVIHFCAFRGYDALAKKILDLKIVNVNDTTRRGNTALHAAAESGQGSMVRLLLQYGADPVIRNKQGKSAADLSRNDGIKSPLYGTFLTHGYMYNCY